MSRQQDIARELREIAHALAGDAADYLEEFVAVSAWSALAVLEAAERGERADEPLAELEAQGRAVLETIDELADQAQRAAILRAVMASTRMLALAAAP